MNIQKTSPAPTRFINLTRDFGFKICYADPENPELLIGLLNAVIPERRIVSVTFLDPNVLAPDEDGKRPVYDVRCEDSEGNQFIVEMQKDPYVEYADRVVLYSGDPLIRLLKKGEGYDTMRTLYVISVLGGFLKVRGEDRPRRDVLVRRAYICMEDTNKILSDKENLIFLQLPAVKAIDSDSGFLEKWAWYVSHISEFDERPEGLDEYFRLLFDSADRNNISERKLSIYDSMERDEIAIEAEKRYVRETALEEGIEQGLKEGIAKGREEGREAEKITTARKMKVRGFSTEDIMDCTGLPAEEINGM